VLNKFRGYSSVIGTGISGIAFYGYNTAKYKLWGW